MVRTCLGSLRKSLSAQDPQQCIIDQLEQAVASLVDLATSSMSPRDPSPTLSRKHYSRSTKRVSNTSSSHDITSSYTLNKTTRKVQDHYLGNSGVEDK